MGLLLEYNGCPNNCPSSNDLVCVFPNVVIERLFEP